MKSFLEKLKYGFDNVMSKGTVPSIVLLLVVSLFMILIFAAITLSLNINPEGQGNLDYKETVWMSMMRTLDPGTMGDDRGWSFRVIMLLVTSYGIIMLSTFIGLVSNGILTKVIELRKGRSRVLEKNHVLILGWSSKIHTIISELVIANENQRKPVIVILANKDKVKMEDMVAGKVPNCKNTKLIFRSGNPIDINDLEIANPNEAKSIIILGKKNENSDAEVIKVILAITRNTRKALAHYHIIAEINQRKNLEVARMIGEDQVELILSDELISRILVQTSRQAGLSVVYTDLLDFQGDEIYFTAEPKLIGKTFKEALFSYEKSAIIGIHTPHDEVIINPAGATVLEAGTKIISISSDDGAVIYTGLSSEIQADLIGYDNMSEYFHDNVLILGWNKRAELIIKELSSYSRSSASITVVSELKLMDKIIDRLNSECPKTDITYIEANTSDKHVLDEIDVNNFDHLILLSYQDHYDIQQADAKTLITLLHLRSIGEKWGMTLNVVSEMLDAKNRELAKVTKADDFIISDNIISLIISQVAENKYLMRVFEQLFKSEGNEVYLKPAVNYVSLDKEVNFYTVLESAQRKNEIAFGYRIMENFRDESENYGIRINPKKSEKIVFSAIDFIIVLAKN